MDQRLDLRAEGRPSERPRAMAPLTREIGRYLGKEAGPTLIAIGGIHGNEQAGILASERVIERLERSDLGFRGEFLALRGNMSAARAGCRHIAKDLNRVWSETDVARLRSGLTSPLDAEDQEQIELLAAVEDAMRRARGKVHVVDLHTTSANGIPFIIFGDTLAQRRLVSHIPVPVILGLEDQVDGCLSEYWTRRGCVTFSVEGGQHQDPASIDNLQAVLYLTLKAAGLVGESELRETQEAHAHLERLRGALPPIMEVVSRHAITKEDEFRMQPGFKNLDHVRGGQLLARDRRGEIRATEDGIIIMPLYQGQGSDGFFWGRAPSERKLRVTERLREMKVEKVLSFLPGVKRDPSGDARLIISGRVAKVFPREVLHAFGYRRIRERDGQLIVERQPGE